MGSKRESVENLLEKANVWPLLTQGENIQCGCPFAPYTHKHKHDVDRSPSMGLLVTSDEEPTRINCFTCDWKAGVKGDGPKGVHRLFLELAKHDKERWGSFVDEAASIEEVDLEAIFMGLRSRGYGTHEEHDRGDPIEAWQWSPFKMVDRPGYLLDRGISSETADAWGVGYDKHENRVVIPIRDRDEVLWGAVGRDVTGRSKMKYKNYWNFKRRYTLVGEHMVRDDTELVVCEGPLDALALWDVLRKNDLLDSYSVVSTMGAEVRKEQVDLMVSLSSKVIIAFDNDRAGKIATIDMVKALSGRVRVHRVRYKDVDGSDPADIGEAMIPLLENSVPAFINCFT